MQTSSPGPGCRQQQRHSSESLFVFGFFLFHFFLRWRNPTETGPAGKTELTHLIIWCWIKTSKLRVKSTPQPPCPPPKKTSYDTCLRNRRRHIHCHFVLGVLQSYVSLLNPEQGELVSSYTQTADIMLCMDGYTEACCHFDWEVLRVTVKELIVHMLVVFVETTPGAFVLSRFRLNLHGVSR